MKAQKVYEMVILTTGFGEFEFSRTFCRARVEEKKCGKIQIPRIL